VASVLGISSQQRYEVWPTEIDYFHRVVGLVVINYTSMGMTMFLSTLFFMSLSLC